MRIKLIYPRTQYVSRSTKAKQYLVPPQGLLALAAATPPQHEVEIHDEGLRPLPMHDRPDLVGITVYIASAARAYDIARQYRMRGVPVVLGGLHVSAMPAEAMAHTDAVVVGEGDEIWPEVVADAQAGRLRRRYDAPPPTLANTQVPNRSRTLCRGYLTRNALLATRGCNRQCRFCYRTSMPHSPFRRRPVACVRREVEGMDGKYFVLLDDNLCADHDYALRLFRELRKSNKIWMGSASVDVAKHEPLLDAMAESGCISLFIGLETICQSNLDAMHKGSNRVASYATAIARIRQRGIMINGSFIFGFDHDDDSVFDRTVDWALAQKLDTATFHILTPYPGTPLFAQFEQQGRILDRSWSHYDTAHVVFRPERMSPATLLAGYSCAYDRFYSLGNLIRRTANEKWARTARLLLNIGYKRMNPLWPLLARLSLTSTTFSIFIKAAARHRRSWQWQTAAEPRPAAMECSP